MRTMDANIGCVCLRKAVKASLKPPIMARYARCIQRTIHYVAAPSVWLPRMPLSPGRLILRASRCRRKHHGLGLCALGLGSWCAAAGSRSIGRRFGRREQHGALGLTRHDDEALQLLLQSRQTHVGKRHIRAMMPLAGTECQRAIARMRGHGIWLALGRLRAFALIQAAQHFAAGKPLRLRAPQQPAARYRKALNAYKY